MASSDAAARACFVAHDGDANGAIDEDELTRALTTLGLKHEGESDAAFRGLVRRCMREHDANADGTLSFNEFRRLYDAVVGVATEDRREAASGSSLDARSLPSATFTEGAPRRDARTGGIVTDVARDFRLGQVLGTGGFAVVKRATHLRTNARYAIKIIDIARAQTAGEEEGMSLDEIAEEIRLTMSVNTTENAVKVYDFYLAKNHVYVVMELLEGGELLEALMTHGEFDEPQAARCVYELLKGLASIHARSITHRDVKLENLIFAEKDSDGGPSLSSLRIADFGLAKKMKTARGRLVAQCGTPAYVAPEVIAGQKYTPAVDCWAAGVVMYATLCGELPFDHDDQQSSFKLIARGKYHEPSVRLTPDCRDLMDGLLCVDKVKRLTAAEALEHRWIRRHAGGTDAEGKRLGGGASVRSIKSGAAGGRVARAAEKALGSDLRVRKIKKGELLIREGERAKEVFLIKEGTCAVEAAGADGRVVRVAERGAGEFVGEMGVRIEEDNREVADDASPRGEGGAGYSPGGGGGPKAPLGSTLAKVRSKWVGGRRGASVRAATDVVALAMNASQMRWILEHDYGADGEVGVAVEARQKELDRVTGGWKRGAS